MQRYADAVNLLLRFAVVCDTTGATGSQCKCYLSAVVVWLFAGDASQAWAVYQVCSLPCMLCLRAELFQLDSHLQAKICKCAAAGCTGSGRLLAE